MRHRVKKKTLKRDGDHRKSLLRNLSTSLVLNESIVTTVSKAKYLRPYVEKLITKAKKGDDFNTVKYMKSVLYKDEAVKKIIDDLAPRFQRRNGGYTRIIKIGNRSGDNAPLAIIEFVEKPKKMEKTEKKSEKEKKESSKKVAKKEKEEKKKTDSKQGGQKTKKKRGRPKNKKDDKKKVKEKKK